MSVEPFFARYRPIEGDDLPSRAKDALTGPKPAEFKPDAIGKSETAVARLSERFRVAIEGGSEPQQWYLQRRKIINGQEAWEAISFCMSRSGLLLAIREKCILPANFHQRHEYPGLDPAAVAVIKALPEHFQHMKKNGSVDHEPRN
jgi:hypothetical protein